MNIIFTNNFIATMRRFLFILSVVLTAYCSTADRFQKWQEDINNEGLGLGVAHAFANNQQEELPATGRRWIKDQFSKLRRSKFRWRITRSCGIRQDNASISVSCFSLFFLLLLAGDVELKPGPTATKANNSSSENSVLELPILIAKENVHLGDTSFSEESHVRQCAFITTSMKWQLQIGSLRHLMKFCTLKSSWMHYTEDLFLMLQICQLSSCQQLRILQHQMKITMTCPLWHKMKYLNPLW